MSEPCPVIDDLLSATPAALVHARGCEACAGVMELASSRSEVDCDTALALLAASDELATPWPLSLSAHLDSCPSCGELIAVWRPADTANAQPSYRLGPELGRGGMGCTREAFDLRLGRPVAIKELSDPQLAARFEREAKLTARLDHPGIVTVHEFGRRPDGRPFYSMRLVRGEPLHRRIERARSLRERLPLLDNVVAMVDAVAFAHEQGIVHRDLKPANAVLGPFGETVVIDWGLAKDFRQAAKDAADPTAAAIRDDGLTAAGAGTAQYMSPEQAAGADAAPQADVYSLGATLYHVLAGQAPYADLSRERSAQGARAGPPTPIRRLVEVPADLEAILEKAMAPDPGQRYPTAGGLANDLRRFRQGELVGVHRYSWAERALKLARRHRALVRLSGIAILLLAVTGGFAVARVVREQRRARESEARVLEDRGRELLLAGRPLEALDSLARVDPGFATPAMRSLLAASARPADSRRFSLQGHSDALVDAVASPDGIRILTASEDGSARLWNANDGAPIASLADHLAAIRAASFSRDGRNIVTASNDGSAKLWDGESGRLLRTLRGHEGMLFAAVFSPDGKQVVTAGQDRRVEVWNAVDGTRMSSWTGFAGPILVAFAGGDVLSTSTDVRTLSLRGGDFSAPWWKLAFPEDDAPFALEATLDGSRAAIGMRDGEVLLLDVARGSLIATQQRLAGSARQVSFSPDGKLLASAGAEPVARIWDGRTGAPVAVLTGHERAVRFVSFSPDGSEAVTAGEDGDARVWDARTGALLALLEGRGAPLRTARFFPDGRRVVTADEAGVAVVWDTSLRARRAALSLPGHVMTAAPMGDGAILGTRDGTVWRWLPGRPAWGLPAGAESARAAVTAIASRGGRVAASSADGSVRLWPKDPSSPATAVLAHGGLASAIAIAPRADLIATGTADGALLFWDESLALLRELKAHRDRITSLVFAPAGDALLSADADGRAFLWNPATGALLHELPGHRDAIRCAAFSADGRRLATGSDDFTVRVWERASGALVATLRGHGGPVRSVAFSPDGTSVLTASFDGTARSWSATTATSQAVLRDPSGPLAWASFADDGRIITASHSGSVAVWEAASGRLLSREETRLHLVAAYLVGSGREVLALGTEGAAVFDLHEETRAAADIVALRHPQIQAPADSPPAAQSCAPKDCASLARKVEQAEGSDRLAHALDVRACAGGVAGSCVRSLRTALLIDVLPDGHRDFILFQERRHGGLVLQDGFGGSYREGTMKIGRLDREGMTTATLGKASIETLHPSQAALGRDGSALQAFVATKHRPGSFEFDGLLFHIDPSTLLSTRRMLFTDWNAGFFAHFAGAHLLHYSFTDNALADGRLVVRRAHYREIQEASARAMSARLGLADDSTLYDATGAAAYRYLLERWDR